MRRPNFNTIDITAAKSMNKAMFFMANCTHDDVKKLVYKAFDYHMAEHIFGMYTDNINSSSMPFFDVYFQVDKDCKAKICDYIKKNYNKEEKLV